MASAESWDALLPEGTPEGQRRAVEAEDAIVTVGAGAGTGKTWVLSNRYARLLLSNPDLLPRDILTLTYTESAASEMKERIESRMLKLMEEPGFPVSPARERALRDGFSETWISTIHAFASRLIRESGLTLDIDPRAAVVTTPQEEGFWDSVREAAEFASMEALAVKHLGKNPAGREERLTSAAKALDRDPFISAAVSKWRSSGLSALARKAAELHSSMGRNWAQMMDWADILGTDFFGTAPDFPLIQEARAHVRAVLLGEWRKTWRIWQGIFGTLGDTIRAERENKKISKTNARILACLERWDGPMAVEPDEETLREFYFYILDSENIKGGKSSILDGVRAILGMTLGDWQGERRKSTAAALTKKLDASFPEDERRLWSSLLRFCAVSWGLWDTMKRRRGLLSFSDMILHAREVGRRGDAGNTEKSFHHILVDEFQDTDPLQFELIESLTRRGGERGSSLFAVGDPKQSIYGFRYADPSLFAALVQKAEERGTKVELDVSFRTRKALLDRINDLFSYIWRDGLAPGGTGPLARLKFEPLDPAPAVGADARRNEGTTPPFSMMLSAAEGRRIKEPRERLAYALARRISGWVREGRTVWDRQAHQLRPLRWKDFAVLARKRTCHELLELALKEEGIPTVQDKSKNYMARGEVGDVISLLRAAADPEDDVAVAGWLFSPFSDVPEEEAVQRLASLSKLGGVSASQRFFNLIEEKLPHAAQRLRELSLIGQRQGAVGLLSLLDRDRRWLLEYGDSLRALRNVRRALAIARGFEREGTSSLTACADWMTHALRQKVQMEEPAWLDKGTDAVLLATVHQSKGLEYPVTILFDAILPKSGGNENSLRPSRELGLTFPELPDEMKGETLEQEDAPKKAVPLGRSWEKLLTAQGEWEESMRLLYVALTRAQDSLVVCGLLSGSGGAKDTEKELHPLKASWTSLILERMEQRGELNREDYSGPLVTLIADDDLTEPPASRSAQPEQTPLPRFVSRPGMRGVRLETISATSFAMFTWCPLAWRRRYRQGLDLRWESPDRDLMMEEGDSMKGAERGSLAHWILARWPSAEGDPEAELERWLTEESTLRRLPSYLRDAWRETATKSDLRKWLNRFAASSAGADLRRALGAGAQREARFRVGLFEDSVRRTELVGAMDAAWREKDEGLWRVMDYKITLEENAPAGLYEAQMDFYALVLKEAALHDRQPCEAVEVELVFLRNHSRTERRRIGGGDWDALRERALEMSRAGASGPYPPKREHCSDCPWRVGCFV